jgi:hypothetical protein
MCANITLSVNLLLALLNLPLLTEATGSDNARSMISASYVFTYSCCPLPCPLPCSLPRKWAECKWGITTWFIRISFRILRDLCHVFRPRSSPLPTRPMRFASHSISAVPFCIGIRHVLHYYKLPHTLVSVVVSSILFRAFFRCLFAFVGVNISGVFMAGQSPPENF